MSYCKIHLFSTPPFSSRRRAPVNLSQKGFANTRLPLCALSPDGDLWRREQKALLQWQVPSTSASQSSFQVIPNPAIQGLPCGETQTLAPPEIAAAHLSPGTQVVLSPGGGASFKFPCLRRGLAIGMPSLNIEVWWGALGANPTAPHMPHLRPPPRGFGGNLQLSIKYLKTLIRLQRQTRLHGALCGVLNGCSWKKYKIKTEC